ncbi:MAG: hypothetical protein A2493_00860 [Candidatus Magasanikbacteria bacterium RIFOXYC12_FULL_33_11]|uniref:Glycosyltransferase subfamily 4-like N-terminal domain-containing protein n=1 Tax=Candidatus Magasanikbacteria bacterium RIFOXYC12_FULL_33_11 TaxID=1798701 RepID=A0A1F6NMI7_9BACT|nr:MAG: hypothetical protein A2493_00860 [Candidatus Magasanikbacteria bacterium RIFOXYC12_FULL_33_11]
MKIVIIHNLYEPYSRGGAEQVVKTSIDFLLSQGDEVILITSTPEKEELYKKENLKIYRLKQNNIISYFDLVKYNFVFKFVWHLIDMFNFGIAQKVKKILQQENPGVVHTHNLMGLSFFIPRIIRKLKIKNIQTVHDVQLVEPSGIIFVERENSWRYSGFLIKIHIWIMKKLVGSPDVVISPTQFLLDFYKNKGFFKNSKLEKLANPFTLQLPNNFQKQFHSGLNFLYLGQLEQHKGIVDLLEVFQDIKEATLHVVGDGILLENLKNKYSQLENIKFYGRKGRGELAEIFAKTDVTIFPSLCYENYPAVIFESFTFAVPVLAAKHSALTELIKKNENGWFFDVLNTEDLKNKIVWCLQNKTDITIMSAKMLQDFSSTNNINYFQKLIAFYKN